MQTVLRMKVNITNESNALKFIQNLAIQKKGAYVCVSNVHMCMETFDSPEFMSIVNNADYILPDGRPIYWAQYLLGNKNAEQVRGEDIMKELCKTSVVQKLNIGLYGGCSDYVLKSIVEKLKVKYPGISISYFFSPPFRELRDAERKEVIRNINNSGTDILFVGIGCPKQEKWMAAHKSVLNCTMLGVGAAFDFIAGSKKQAPVWMQKLGIEWLFRLLHEPKRLHRRYLFNNPRFIYYFLLQFIKHIVRNI